MEIEVISCEKIKPNSPTPDHLKIYKISRLDQTIFPAYVPAILYFSPINPTCTNINIAESISQRSELLKKSLSSTLSTFYPFAGVIRDPLSVDCNDQGLAFYVAKVETQLRDFLANPDLQLIKRFLPSECSWSGAAGPGANVVTIQLTFFDCGGMAVSVVFVHSIADITSVSTFLKAWAAMARGGSASHVKPLNCVAQSAFPQKEDDHQQSDMLSSLPRFLISGKFVTRRYVFAASALSALKDEAKTASTRVELVTAFLWKCFMQAAADDQKPFWLTHPVNLRRRAEPGFADDSFGNFLMLASAIWTKYSPMDDHELKEVVEEVKRSIRAIDKELVQSLQSDEGYHKAHEDFRKGMPEEGMWFAFTSWCRVGLYDVDFGWGKPVWLAGAVCGDSDSTMPNSTALVETRSGDGIEAWVNLHEKYVAGFENNEKLKMYAHFNPTLI